ncbi:Imm21 family immunity protein [Streptomyces sp. NPDC058691]|uniref:Imm21 family immunity protein n=1 Tax=Streptomyces sp. NPDC058691 TaxID=3346601 RepID=UPI003655C910
MNAFPSEVSAVPRPAPVWVESMGGPMIVVPVSALAAWGGCTEAGMVLGDGDVPDDYDRACAVDDLAEVIPVGRDGALALVLGDEPATTCYLPAHRAFLRWLGAGSEAGLIDAAEAVLADPAITWEQCGTWDTDGPAVLMDSAAAGSLPGVGHPGGGLPEQARVPLPPGRWTVDAVEARAGGRTSLGLVRLVPAVS